MVLTNAPLFEGFRIWQLFILLMFYHGSPVTFFSSYAKDSIEDNNSETYHVNFHKKATAACASTDMKSSNESYPRCIENATKFQ